MAASLPLELLAMWLYMQAIRESPLSLTLPYLAFTPVFNTLTGYLILGETVSWTGFSGILLVVLGAWLLNLEAAQNGAGLNLLAPFRAITRERGSRLMLMVAAIYSLTSVTSKGALGRYCIPTRDSSARFILWYWVPHPSWCLPHGMSPAGAPWANIHGYTWPSVPSWPLW
jgi:hypothetical protein